MSKTPKTVVRTLLFASLIFFFTQSFAQSTDFGLWGNLSIEKKYKDFAFQTSLDYRTQNNASILKRYGFDFSAAYQPGDVFETGLKYQWMFFNDLKYSDIQPRQRYAGYFQFKIKSGDFTFYIREQFQRTIKDERDRIKENGYHDTYSVNPEWEWRNRFKIKYNIPKFKINPSFYIESFYLLNDPDENYYNQWRYNLAFSYKINKHNEIELYSMFENDRSEDPRERTFIVGLNYKIDF